MCLSGFAYMYVCTLQAHLCTERPEECDRPPKLEKWTAVSHHMGAGNQAQVFQ